MSLESNQRDQLFFRTILHAVLVLTMGLVAGLMLTFSLLDAVSLWPFPAWEVAIPGSTRGWQAAHVGGILNAVMLVSLALISNRLHLSHKQFQRSCWGLMAIGWGNTVFYWAGNLAPNRGLSIEDTPFGSADIAGAIAFIGGGGAMIIAFLLMYMYASAAYRLSRG